MALRKVLLEFSPRRGFLEYRQLLCSCSGSGIVKVSCGSLSAQQGRQLSSGGDEATKTLKRNCFFPRRAVMYVPASDERKTKKAATLNVDTLVFDLEDGVATNQKVQ